MSGVARTAVILAAGRGSRLGPRGEDRPKCLVEVAGRSLLDWQLDALHAAGIERVVVVGGYRGDMLSGPFERLENPRWAETNMVASLACAAGELRCAPCVVAYADILYAPDHVIALMHGGGAVAIAYDTEWLALWRLRFDDPLVDAETFAARTAGYAESARGPRIMTRSAASTWACCVSSRRVGRRSRRRLRRCRRNGATGLT